MCVLLLLVAFCGLVVGDDGSKRLSASVVNLVGSQSLMVGSTSLIFSYFCHMICMPSVLLPSHCSPRIDLPVDSLFVCLSVFKHACPSACMVVCRCVYMGFFVSHVVVCKS